MITSFFLCSEFVRGEIGLARRRRSLLVVVLSGAAHLARLLGGLFIIWLTLDWKVWRAKRAFERELTKQGMSREDAKRLSAKYAALKDEAVNAFKRSWRVFS